jgi:hypothetical protein
LKNQHRTREAVEDVAMAEGWLSLISLPRIVPSLFVYCVVK